MMKKQAASAAKWSSLLAFSALGSILAGCGHSGGSGPMTSLTVAPSTITLGQSAVLTWSSIVGTTCAARGGWNGTKPANGMADVTPLAAGTTIYTLTCGGGGFEGNSTRSVALTVGPASAYAATTLVEDAAGGAAPTVDPLLVNPWGLAFAPSSAFLVVNNHSDTVTIYNGNGQPSPLVAHFAPGAGGASFDATGIVYNPTWDFVIPDYSPALFLFAGESGMIAGWPSADDLAHATTLYTAPDGAVYKGLALANNGNGNFLYATDFANGKIDVLDATFTRQTPTATTFAFDDPALPADYAPFGIEALDVGATTRIFVTYAQHDEAEPDDDAPGPGLGVVNVFDANGTLLKHLVPEGGKLNAPWGMALAPADFGTLSNALLVANFGDGTIQGYDSGTGRYLGAVTDGALTPFAVPGLWGIAFGNDAVNQPHATLFFAAGTNDEADGRYGRIDLGTSPPVLGQAPALTLIAPPGDLSGTVTLAANAENLVSIANVRFVLNGSTLIGTATHEPFTVEWDTTTVGNGDATLRAVATDADGNVGSSGILTVSVRNPAAHGTGTRTTAGGRTALRSDF
jgi:uncharacterized protein (TIGR03118 family)